MNDLFPQAVAVGQTGKYMALAAGATSPYLYQHNYTTGTFNKTANPSTLPVANAFSVAYSNNGDYLAVSSATSSPYMRMYKRSGDTLVNISFPTLPIYANNMAFSPDDTYLAVSMQGNNGTKVFKRSGDTFTEITDSVLTSINTGSSGHYGCAWSPDGLHLAVGRGATPFIKILKRTGDTFSDITPATNMPSASVRGISYSADGTKLYMLQQALNSTSAFKIQSRSGDTYTFSSGAGLDTATNANGNGFALSPDGIYLVITFNTSPYLVFFKFNGSSQYLKQANPSTMPTNASSGFDNACWSSDGNYFVYGAASSPFLYLYQRSGDVLNIQSNPTLTPADSVNNARFWPIGIPGSK